MIHGKKVVVVLPAYNAALTLEQTYREIPFDIVDEVVLVDDAGGDDTLSVGAKLGIKHLIQHEKNLGYGGNQKTCYRKALDLGADIIIMLHPDYQYTPTLIPAMAHLVATGIYPVVIGSRILGKGAIAGACHGSNTYRIEFLRCRKIYLSISTSRSTIRVIGHFREKY